MATKAELLIEIAQIAGDKKAESMQKSPKSDLESWLENHENSTKSMSATMLKYRTKYEPSLSASGRKSLNSGDEIAHMLAGMDAKAVIATAERLLKMKTGELWEKYQNLNLGQQRMNAGNRIRGAVKREEVTVKDVKQAIKG